MAPAITLKRMYHCVPSSIRAMEPMPRPPPILTQADEQNGEEGGGRNRGQHLRNRLNDAREPGIEADGDADRNGPRGGDQQRRIDAQKRGGRALQQHADVGPA